MVNARCRWRVLRRLGKQIAYLRDGDPFAANLSIPVADDAEMYLRTRSGDAVGRVIGHSARPVAPFARMAHLNLRLSSHAVTVAHLSKAYKGPKDVHTGTCLRRFGHGCDGRYFGDVALVPVHRLVQR